uniref:NACHT, LRR and PYD domains-containing protein 3 n=1 Tax=Anser cygnoides TaxID=8845 RepID=A0A8B9DPJ9_ANSCY
MSQNNGKRALTSKPCFFAGDFLYPMMAGEGSAFTVLLAALEGLTLEGFQEFKTKLSHVHTKGGWNIPEDVLVEATHPSTLVNCMGNSYGEDAAVDIAIGLFEEMNQRDLAEKILDEKVKEYKQKYREHVAREFLRYKELNSCLGENLSVSSRYTALTIAKKPWSQSGGEPEGADVSWGCADTTIAVTAQTLFKPDEDGQTPQTVVLVGAPGMGKTMMVRKMMVEWVEGALYMQFDYVFCIDCKELSLSKQVSMLDLVSKCCPHQRIPAGSILDNQEKVLFVFDGFEALGFPLAQPKDELSSDPREAKPLETTLMSLLKRTVLPASSLLITTRPTALQNLGQCLEGECYVEILGFSAAAREEYFHRYFKNDNKADVAFRFTRGNETLYSLCVIPIMSWTICTILEQELYKKNNLLECSKATTWMGMFYLSWLMKCRGSNAQQYLQQFLRRLCSLAADGIWKHKVLFEEREIKDCGLDWPDLLSLFLNEKSLKKGVDQGNVYSFTHLHLHEFFAAMFYVLDDDEETVSDPEALAKNVNTLLESYSKSRKDLNLTIRFLFGLVNPKSIEYAGERIGCRISPRAREDLLRWLQTRYRGLSHRSEVMMIKELDTFHFLFEMNEKSFAQKVLGCFTGIDLHDIKLTPYDQMALCFCIKQWDGLDSVTLRSCSFRQQQCSEEPATVLPWQHPRQEELRSPLHPLCQALGHVGSSLQNLRLRYTRMTSACCQDLAAVLGTSPHLEELDLSFNTGLRDAGVQLLCEGLRDHACQLRVLRLGSCHLMGTCCQALATHLGENCSLSCLDLSDTELGAGAVLLLRQLRHPACPLQALGLSVSALNEDALQELVALRELKPSLKIGDLLEHDTPQEGAMSRLPFQRGVWEVGGIFAAPCRHGRVVGLGLRALSSRPG